MINFVALPLVITLAMTLLGSRLLDRLGFHNPVIDWSRHLLPDQVHHSTMRATGL